MVLVLVLCMQTTKVADISKNAQCNWDRGSTVASLLAIGRLDRQEVEQSLSDPHMFEDASIKCNYRNSVATTAIGQHSTWQTLSQRRYFKISWVSLPLHVREWRVERYLGNVTWNTHIRLNIPLICQRSSTHCVNRLLEKAKRSSCKCDTSGGVTV